MGVFVGFYAPVAVFDDVIAEPYSLIPIGERHMTLVYLGEPRSRLDDIASGLKEVLVGEDPLSLVFNKLEPFPSPTKPRYIAAVPAPSPRLLRLRHKIVLKLGSSDKYGEFRPHVSIAYTRAKPSLALYRIVENIVRGARGKSQGLVVDSIGLFEARRGKLRLLASIELCR